MVSTDFYLYYIIQGDIVTEIVMKKEDIEKVAKVGKYALMTTFTLLIIMMFHVLIDIFFHTR